MRYVVKKKGQLSRFKPCEEAIFVGRSHDFDTLSTEDNDFLDNESYSWVVDLDSLTDFQRKYGDILIRQPWENEWFDDTNAGEMPKLEILILW
jgi:hypothetical protein